jgi:hypothetical protein
MAGNQTSRTAASTWMRARRWTSLTLSHWTRLSTCAQLRRDFRNAPSKRASRYPRPTRPRLVRSNSLGPSHRDACFRWNGELCSRSAAAVDHEAAVIKTAQREVVGRPAKSSDRVGHSLLLVTLLTGRNGSAGHGLAGQQARTVCCRYVDVHGDRQAVEALEQTTPSAV